MLALLAVAAWIALQWVLELLGTGGEVGSATNAVLLAALAGIGYLYRSSQEKRQQLETRLAESKRALYEDYVDVFKEVVAAGKLGKTDARPDHINRLRGFAFRSILIASDPVVRAHVRFTNAARISSDDRAAMPAVADVLLALRRDMGFIKTELTARDLLGVFVNEIDADVIGGPFDAWERAKPAWDEKMGWKSGNRSWRRS